MTQIQAFEKLLETKPFEELLKDGDILDVQGAAARTGYDPQHVRRLCHDGKLPHITRGITSKEVQYYFLPEFLVGIFKVHPGSGIKKARV